MIHYYTILTKPNRKMGIMWSVQLEAALSFHREFNPSNSWPRKWVKLNMKC